MTQGLQRLRGAARDPRRRPPCGEAGQRRRARRTRADLHQPGRLHAHREGPAAPPRAARGAAHRDRHRRRRARSTSASSRSTSRPRASAREWQNLADDDFDGRFMIATDLQDILERVSTTIIRTSEHLPRFAGYPPRMETALGKVLEGQHEFLTSPTVESFHNVWMECHEDYLLTLGHLARGGGQLLMPTTSIHPDVVAFDAAGEPDAARLGGKGASLVKMVGLGMPVPPGFILSTDIGRELPARGGAPRGRPGRRRARAADRSSSSSTGGSATPTSPLLVSVRSGAPVSMPGMMDTILNVGLNDDVVEGLARDVGDAEFAWSSYERLLDSFATTVRGISAGVVEEALLDAPTAGLEPWEAAPRARKGAAGADPRAGRRRVPAGPAARRSRSASTPSSAPGTARAPRPTASSAASTTRSAPPASCSRWCSATASGEQPSGSGVAFSRDPSTGAPERLRRDPLRRAGRGRRLRRARRRPAGRAHGAPARPRPASSTRSSPRSSATRAT